MLSGCLPPDVDGLRLELGLGLGFTVRVSRVTVRVRVTVQRMTIVITRKIGIRMEMVQQNYTIYLT